MDCNDGTSFLMFFLSPQYAAMPSTTGSKNDLNNSEEWLVLHAMNSIYVFRCIRVKVELGLNFMKLGHFLYSRLDIFPIQF